MDRIVWQLGPRLPLALPQKYKAADTVVLGQTGIKTSRLAMGTGTIGFAHHSNQTALGVKGLSELLLNGYDQGLRFFDAADAYGSHPHVAEALKHLPRDKITVLTKSWSRVIEDLQAHNMRYPWEFWMRSQSALKVRPSNWI